MSTYKEPLCSMCVFVFVALNMGKNTGATCMHKYVLLLVCLPLSVHTLMSQRRVSLVLILRGSHVWCCIIKYFVVCMLRMCW